MTERYILLVGTHYYPSAWEDFKGTFKTKGEAKSYAQSYIDDTVVCQDYKWAQIVDKETMKLVSECLGFDDNPDETLWEETKDD